MPIITLPIFNSPLHRKPSLSLVRLFYAVKGHLT
jgi:hypothetical protein